MKKISILLSAFVLTVSMFTACGGKTVASSSTSSEAVSSEVSSTSASSSASSAASSAAQSTATTVQASADLSGDIRSGQVEMGGVVYTFPLENVQVLFDNGYTAKKALDFSVPSGNTTGSYRMENSAGAQFIISFYNKNAETTDVNECAVDSFSLFDSDYDESKLKVVFPGGFSIGSSYDEMIAAYGEPDKVSDTETTTYVDYIINGETFNKISLEFDKDKKLKYVFYLLTRSVE